MRSEQQAVQSFVQSYLKKLETLGPTPKAEEGRCIRAIQTGGGIKAEVLTTEQILRWSVDMQNQVRTEIEYLIHKAFPKMSQELKGTRIGEFFKRPGNTFHRPVILLRDESDKLLASTLFDYGPIEYKRNILTGIYIISCSVLPEYQGLGLGKTTSIAVFAEWQPDVLLITCSQSASLHSWVGLVQKGVITNFHVYPRLEQEDGIDRLFTVPYRELEFFISAFQQTFAGVVEGKQDYIEHAINNLTVRMVRKQMYGNMYDFDPWQKHGREDKLANALGLTEEDGILAVFRKDNL